MFLMGSFNLCLGIRHPISAPTLLSLSALQKSSSSWTWLAFLRSAPVSSLSKNSLIQNPAIRKREKRTAHYVLLKKNAHSYTHKLLTHIIIRNKLCCLLHSPETLRIPDISFLKMKRHLEIFHMQIPCIFWIDAWELICPLICPTVAKFNKATIQAHFSFQEISAADALSFLSCFFYWLPLPQLTRSHISLGMMLKPCFCVFLFLIG